jgi:hypothetical protein
MLLGKTFFYAHFHCVTFVYLFYLLVLVSVSGDLELGHESGSGEPEPVTASSACVDCERKWMMEMNCHVKM